MIGKTNLITTIRRYAAARATSNMYSAPTGANLSPLIRKSLEKGQQPSKRKNKSIGPDCICGEILKLGGEALIPYLARLLDTTMNSCTLPANWKRAVVVPVHKRIER